MFEKIVDTLDSGMKSKVTIFFTMEPQGERGL